MTQAKRPIIFEPLESRRLYATVTVNAGQVLRAIDGRLAGTNVTYWQWELDTAQMKNMITASGMKLFRLPGGSASDGDLHFNKPPPYNGYKTAPIIANVIQSVGGDGMVTLNYGSGSPQESAALLAYYNAPVGSNVAIGNGQQWNATTSAWVQKDWKTSGYWASLRAAAPLASDDGLNFLRVNHPAPWGFHYYEIGNEEYATWEEDHHASNGQGGSSPSTYIGFAKAFSVLAAQIDPNVKVGIDVSIPLQFNMPDSLWTDHLLQQSVAQNFLPGFLSDHIYVTGLSDQNLLLHSVNDPNFKQGNVSAGWAARASYYRTRLNQNFGAPAAGVQLMATEFNSDINTKQASNLVGGLWAADAMGGIAQTEYTAALEWDLTNGYTPLGSADNTRYGWRQGTDMGLISTGNGPAPSSGPFVPYPIYFSEQLFSKLAQPGGSVISASSNDANLSTYAVKQANGHLVLLVINKSATTDLSGAFNLSGFVPAAQAQLWRYGKAEDTAQSQTTDGHASLTNSTPTLSLSGSSFSLTFPSYSMSVLDLTPDAPPAVSGVTINAGDAQRSVIYSISMTFGERVTLGATAISLTRSGGSPVTMSATSSDNLTFTLTLTGQSVTTLADGLYDISVDPAQVHDSSNQTLTATYHAAFHRLFGDSDGDRDVDNLDALRFRQAQGSLQGQSTYKNYFDFDGDGDVDNLDALRFRQRQGTNV